MSIQNFPSPALNLFPHFLQVKETVTGTYESAKETASSEADRIKQKFNEGYADGHASA